MATPPELPDSACSRSTTSPCASRPPSAPCDAVRNLSFHVERGETLAIVGESGSGKSVTSLALMRLVEHGGGRITGGRMASDAPRRPRARPGAGHATRTMRGMRGADIAMIFQEPMTSLNPVFTVGDQIAEADRHAPGQGPRGRARRGAAHAGAGAHPRGAQRAAALSAPALRRHAPARDDRDGAVLPARAADRRRADHRARRHHPGADPRS